MQMEMAREKLWIVVLVVKSACTVNEKERRKRKKLLVLIDGWINKLHSKTDWGNIKAERVQCKRKLKKNKANFTPFGTNLR